MRWFDVHKHLDGRAVLCGLDAEISPGERVVLTGPPRCGKSVALKTVLGLMNPDEGEVQVDEIRVSHTDLFALRRRLGYARRGIDLWPHLTVAENILLPLSIDAIPIEEQRRVLAEVLAAVELDPQLATRRVSQVAIQEQVRIGLARALVRSPGLVLLDDPFADLAPGPRAWLQDLIVQLQDRLGFTLILATTDAQEALMTAERILVLAGGQIVSDVTPAEVLGGACDPYAASLFMAAQRWRERLQRAEGR